MTLLILGYETECKFFLKPTYESKKNKRNEKSVIIARGKLISPIHVRVTLYSPTGKTMKDYV